MRYSKEAKMDTRFTFDSHKRFRTLFKECFTRISGVGRPPIESSALLAEVPLFLELEHQEKTIAVAGVEAVAPVADQPPHQSTPSTPLHTIHNPHPATTYYFCLEL